MAVTEMLEHGMTPEEILEHIFEGMDLQILDTIPTEFYCNCSKERVSAAVISVGKQELQKMIDDGEPIEVNCHLAPSHSTSFLIESTNSTFSFVGLVSSNLILNCPLYSLASP